MPEQCEKVWDPDQSNPTPVLYWKPSMRNPAWERLYSPWQRQLIREALRICRIVSATAYTCEILGKFEWFPVKACAVKQSSAPESVHQRFLQIDLDDLSEDPSCRARYLRLMLTDLYKNDGKTQKLYWTWLPGTGFQEQGRHVSDHYSLKRVKRLPVKGSDQRWHKTEEGQVHDASALMGGAHGGRKTPPGWSCTACAPALSALHRKTIKR